MRQFWQEILFPLLWRPHLGNLKKSGLRDPGNLTFQLRKAETLGLWKIPSGAWVISHFNRIWLCETLWNLARLAHLFMGFRRQEYWSGLPCPSSGDHPDPGMGPPSLKSPVLAGWFFSTSATWKRSWVAKKILDNRWEYFLVRRSHVRSNCSLF